MNRPVIRHRVLGKIRNTDPIIVITWVIIKNFLLPILAASFPEIKLENAAKKFGKLAIIFMYQLISSGVSHSKKQISMYSQYGGEKKCVCPKNDEKLHFFTIQIQINMKAKYDYEYIANLKILQ